MGCLGIIVVIAIALTGDWSWWWFAAFLLALFD